MKPYQFSEEQIIAIRSALCLMRSDYENMSELASSQNNEEVKKFFDSRVEELTYIIDAL